MKKINSHKAAVQLYLKCIQTINQLVKEKKLQIDWVEARVSISRDVHLVFFTDDKKYLAFFDKIRAWINFQRGKNQIKKLLEPEERLDFYVYSLHTIYMQGDKEISLSDTFDMSETEYVKMEQHKILLVGYNQGQILDYRPVEGEVPKD